MHNLIVCFSVSVVSADEEQDVVGKLKVSVEAAQALTGIYKEYHQVGKRDRKQPRNSTEVEEEKEEEEEGRVIQKNELHVLDFEVDEDSDFYWKSTAWSSAYTREIFMEKLLVFF